MAWLMSSWLKDSLSRTGALWGFASESGPGASGLSAGVDPEEWAWSDLDAAMAGEALVVAVGVEVGTVVAGAVVVVAVATPAPLLLLLETAGSADAEES